MLTENEKRELSQDAGWTDDLYSDRVKQGVNQNKYDRFKEHSLHRKIEYALLMKVLNDEPIPKDLVEEFLNYYNTVENVKSQCKKEVYNEQ